jgi:hypothetical protein
MAMTKSVGFFAMIDRRRLLDDLKPLLRVVEADLRARCEELAQINEDLKQEYDQARDDKRLVPLPVRYFRVKHGRVGDLVGRARLLPSRWSGGRGSCRAAFCQVFVVSGSAGASPSRSLAARK